MMMIMITAMMTMMIMMIMMMMMITPCLAKLRRIYSSLGPKSKQFFYQTNHSKFWDSPSNLPTVPHTVGHDPQIKDFFLLYLVFLSQKGGKKAKSPPFCA